MDGAVAVGQRRTAPALTVAAAVVLAVVALAIGLGRGGSGPPTLQDRVQSIAAELRCPVCQNLSVADSPSELARQMRSDIAARLRDGQTPDQIRSFYVSRYGTWILLTPTGGGIGLVAWAAPAVGLLVGGLVVWFAVSRRRRPAGGAGSDEGQPMLTEAERERVRREAGAVEEPE